jgi:hypothetical protein
MYSNTHPILTTRADYVASQVPEVRGSQFTDCVGASIQSAKKVLVESIAQDCCAGRRTTWLMAPCGQAAVARLIDLNITLLPVLQASQTAQPINC